MSFAANPNKQQRSTVETASAAAARQQKADKDRIRRLLITLGDEEKKVLGQIRGLAGALEDDVELHGEHMADTVLDCAKHLPLKTGIYAAWVGRMLIKHASWVATLVPRVLEELRTSVRSGQASVAQLLLRFVVGLGNCGVLALPAVFGLLDEVQALSDGLKPAKGGDLGTFLALSPLPFLSPAAYKLMPDRVEKLISSGSAYIGTRGASWKSLLRCLKNEDLPDRLQALATALRAQTEAKWSSQTVLHVPGFEPKQENPPDVPALTPLGVTAEEVRKSKMRITIPLITSRLLAKSAQDDGADDQMAEHDLWVLEDYILLSLENFGRDVDECAKQILRIPVLHPQFETIMVATIFSQMLRLPSPHFLPLCYSRLLEEITGKQSSTKPVVEQAFRVLINNASNLDEDTLETLAEAFAYHLMHNGYATDWSIFTGDNVAVQAQRFVRRALERLQRLSFHQNLLHRLPEAVHVYVPPEPLPASSIPLQDRPEFKRMLGFVKIKDASEEKVLQYCSHLQKGNAKDEDEEVGEATTEGGAVVEISGGAEGPEAKRRKLNSGEAQEAASPTATTVKDDNTTAADAASEDVKEPPESEPEKVGDKRKAQEAEAIKVKEEIKQEKEEEESAANAPTATATSAEDPFGEVPSEPLSFETVVGIFVCAALQNGAKTPTHMSKLLDVHAGAFTKLRPESDDEVHEYTKTIVRCVFAFWSCSSQRLEITIDAMLQRGLLTPRAIVEQALAERGAQGCDSIAVWNLINCVARKSLEQSQTARANLAIAKKLGKADELERWRAQLDGAVQDTAELFTLIFTGLVRNHQDFEESDTLLRHVMLQRILTIGRKYHAFVKPLIDAAESRVPGVAHSPEIAAIFQSLGAL